MSGQLWGTSSLGGYMYSDELSDKLRMEVRATAKFRNLCDAKDFSDKGLHKGNTVNWNTYSKLSGTSTKLTETTAIPESNYTVTQGTATVYEYGISVPFTSLLEMFSAHSVTQVTRNVLARDCRETLDREAHIEFNKGLLRYVGTATAGGVLTTNGTATATNSSALNRTQVRNIASTMKERNIPAYQGDDYVCITLPSVLKDLRADLEGVSQYVETGYTKIVNGEVGRFEGVRFTEQTNILKGVSTDGSAWTSNLSNWAYFLGADTVAEIMVVPPEIRGKIPTDYGRDLGMAWFALEGFGIVYGSGNDSGATNSRIVKWDSAA